MEEGLEIFDRLSEAEQLPDSCESFIGNEKADRRLAEHKEWLKSIRHEYPSPKRHLRIGIYIRYFNQTKYNDYLNYHKKQYQDTIALCPNWELVGFYIDRGASAPHMESAPEWCRLLTDCFTGKVDLIITQKVSNVTRKYYEITFLSRILAAMTPPVGIYFVSEDIYTLASYYQHDLKDTVFFPSEDWQLLPDDEAEESLLLTGGYSE